MRHTLETIKLKIRAFNTGRATIGDVANEWANFESELKHKKAGEASANTGDRAYNHGYRIGRIRLIDEIIGETK